MRMSIKKCDCKSGEQGYAEYDGWGIFLFYGCDKCRARKLKKYRPDIKQRYDTDEQIEAD